MGGRCYWLPFFFFRCETWDREVKSLVESEHFVKRGCRHLQRPESSTECYVCLFAPWTFYLPQSQRSVRVLVGKWGTSGVVTLPLWWEGVGSKPGVQTGVTVKVELTDSRVLHQCFFKFDVYMSHQGILLICRFWFSGSEVKPEILHF